MRWQVNRQSSRLLCRCAGRHWIPPRARSLARMNESKASGEGQDNNPAVITKQSALSPVELQGMTHLEARMQSRPDSRRLPQDTLAGQMWHPCQVGARAGAESKYLSQLRKLSPKPAEKNRPCRRLSQRPGLRAAMEGEGTSTEEGTREDPPDFSRSLRPSAWSGG